MNQRQREVLKDWWAWVAVLLILAAIALTFAWWLPKSDHEANCTPGATSIMEC